MVFQQEEVLMDEWESSCEVAADVVVVVRN